MSPYFNLISRDFNLNSSYVNLNSFYFNLRVKRCRCIAPIAVPNMFSLQSPLPPLLVATTPQFCSNFSLLLRPPPVPVHRTWARRLAVRCRASGGAVRPSI